ncbi:MAG: hypothetical protein DRJ63_06700 [Thermoprotei archaeon]|nr:MAG: hypothetical protein DRJ63_06700 [Thermoprotei archaeon]
MFEETEKRLSEGIVWTKYWALSAFTMSLVKGVVGVFSGSLAMVVDAFHGLSDFIVAAVCWIGLWIARRKPTERFPYGYYRAESIASLLVSGAIVYAGVEFIWEGLASTERSLELGAGVYALAVAAASSLVSFVLWRVVSRKGSELEVYSVKTLGDESLVDVLASLGVFVAVLSSMFSVPYVESLVTVAIALFILKTGLVNAYRSLLALMDISPSKEIEEQVERVLESVEGVEGYRDLKLRVSGPVIFGEVTILVKGFLDIKRAHEIAEKIEKAVKNKVPRVEYLTVHIEPARKPPSLVAVPVGADKGLDSPISDHLARAPYIALVKIGGRGLEKVSVLKNPYEFKRMRAGLTLAHWLVENRVEAVVTRHIGEITFHTLRDHFIEIYFADCKNLRECIEKLTKGKLSLLTKPTRELGEERVEKEYVK